MNGRTFTVSPELDISTKHHIVFVSAILETGTMTTQADIDALSVEYKNYIERLRHKWQQLPENQVRSNDVYEVMDSRDRDRVHAIMDAWARYITPFAEAWWKERGFEIIWPDDNSKPIKLKELATA